MSGQKFQYDESGGTFFYFLLSFLALLLVPGTYYLWPRAPKPDPAEKEQAECNCDGCKKKKIILQKIDPWKNTKCFLRKSIIVTGWLILALLAYKVSQFDYEMSNFDPYEILGVSPGASASSIKKAYRQLSLILHPDKETGNEKAFMRLTKAYQALTDKEAMSNWEKYGNPDGPGAMGFGIALPSWIVEKENSVLVLGAYALVFMLALPTAVGMWWYRSIKYTGDQVLLATTKMYYAFFHNTPTMMVKRIIMVLAASYEFEKKHNADIVERESDNDEVPALIRQLPYLSEKNREYPLCYMYSIKARAIIHAHLSRLDLNPQTLEKDRQYIVKKCPYLIQEMITCVNQLIVLAYARQVQHLPTITTIENCMKLCTMIVQASWEFRNPLLQLPHLTEDHLKYFKAKKVKTLQEYAQLKREDRRSILRGLSDSEFEDVMTVLGNMPYVEFKVRSEVMDDENSTVITAGAIVTVTVTLERKNMSELFGDETVEQKSVVEDENREGEKEEEKSAASQAAKKPAWMKQKKGGKKAHNKKGPKKGPAVKPTVADKTATSAATENGGPGQQVNPSPKVKKEKKEDAKDKEEKIQDSDSGTDGDKSDSSDDEDSSPETNKKNKSSEGNDDDDHEWNKFQQRLSKRDRFLDGRTNQSHRVHCPYFPDVKQEYWWVYICDRKGLTLLAAPVHVTSLVDTEEVQLKFTAPMWPNVYTFTVCLRSDSYMGFDQLYDLKLDVKEAAAIPVDHPQWEMSDEESAADGEGGDDQSEFTTDEDVSD
ncbi:translocation protein SEC63 homolog [Trichogramma pretiosum]|uniref:translocation protein SEC63 homolog n=1 Tax=Trichogramma pretiosum TaxID=7493 RepID=UPI0006C9CBF8|nr:translocation protein SEC63 homolog [Trichogramma pretiosum]